MKRPLFVIGTSYFITTWLAFLWDGRLALKLALAAALIGVLCCLLRDKGRFMYTLSVIFLASAAAFAGFNLYNSGQIEPQRELDEKSAVIEGLITDVSYSSAAASYTMRATFVDHPGIRKGTPVIIQAIGELEHRVGDTLRCRVSLKSAPDTSWYRSRGILLVGRNLRDVEYIPAGGYRFERAAIRLGDMLSWNVFSRLKEDNADIVSAMVLGQKNNVPPEVYTAVNRAGTAHLLSVSGLHLSIISAFLLAAFNALRLPRRFGALAAIAVSFLFAILVGFGASVARSFVMTAITLSARAISRRGDSRTSLGFALLFCCFKWPYWAFSWGLWLSVGSTLGIILFGGKISDALYERFNPDNPRFERVVKLVAGAFGISLGAYVFTAPILILMSGWISLVSPLANVLVSPFVSVVILGGIACAVTPDIPLLTDAIVLATDFSTWVVVEISRTLSGLSFAIIALDEAYLLIFVLLASAFTIVLVICRAGRGLVSYAAALLVLSFSIGSLSLFVANRGKLELVTLSPRNTALLIRGDEAVVLGTPDAYEISNLLKYLNYRGIKRIPAIIATDSDERAGSGILRLTGGYETGFVLAPDDAYTVEILREALPGVGVIPGGYASINALGKAVITTDSQNGSIRVQIGKNEIVKTCGKYDIIETIDAGDGKIHIYNDGAMLLPKSIPPAFEPLGAHLFGESRVFLE